MSTSDQNRKEELKTMNDKWEFYKDAEDKWRWRRTAPNGNIVGAATEGYANRSDCEGNARRNGFNDELLAQEAVDKTVQKELSEEKREIKKKAYALYKEHGFKDGNDFVVWLEAERQAGEKSRLKGNKELKGVLFTIAGFLGLIVVLLLIMMFTKKPEVVVTQQPAPELRVMLVVLDPKENENVVAFGDAHFGYDKSTLSPEAKTLLDKDVQSLKENPKIDVRMAGYTSAEGTEAINQKLSEQRANAVRNYLIEKGIAPERITVIGYGRTRPAVYEVTPGNINSKQALANMRVLFEVVVK
jgi:outer membrane protein OmpA-like peptidoglycan-associated protein